MVGQMSAVRSAMMTLSATNVASSLFEFLGGS